MTLCPLSCMLDHRQISTQRLIIAVTTHNCGISSRSGIIPRATPHAFPLTNPAIRSYPPFSLCSLSYFSLLNCPSYSPYEFLSIFICFLFFYSLFSPYSPFLNFTLYSYFNFLLFIYRFISFLSNFPSLISLFYFSSLLLFSFVNYLSFL